MSSATNPNPSQASAMVYNMPISSEAKEESSEYTGSSGLSQRQLCLSNLWAYYACSCYDKCKLDWEGKENLEPLDNEVVAQSGMIPPGYNDVGGTTLPLKFRKPTAPYYLVRVVVNRFTGLLFSQKRSPKIKVLDDPNTEDWLNQFAKESLLWSQMILARTYGGAMGSVGIGFKFKNGKPIVEVHDPRWSIPVFDDEESGELESFEKRFMFPDETRDPDTGQWVQGDFWYRRLITKMTDTIWPRVPVDGNNEPDWDDPAYTKVEVEHNLGFVPVVWVQNHVLQGSIDGWTDAEGIYDMTESGDRLRAQAERGTVANCDPTLVLATDAEWEGVRKGSDNALQVEKGGEAAYLEIAGTGPETALKMAAVYRALSLEVAQCVLDTNFTGPARTEEEVKSNYSSMYECADKLRVQYGTKGVTRLLELVLKAARKLATPVSVEKGEGITEVQMQTVELQPKLNKAEDGTVTKTERSIGEGEIVELNWPTYTEASKEDTIKAVQSAAQAKTTGLVDSETATRHVAPYFQVENVADVVEKAAEEEEKLRTGMADRIAGAAASGVRRRPFGVVG